jgi:putative SOS response-associated peptidase YedK
MCGRFTLSAEIGEIIADENYVLKFDRRFQPRYNIAPTQDVAAVLNDGERAVRLVRWGLIPSWAKDPAIGNRMIIARAESVAEKPSFRVPLRRKRCLILADGFYEWKVMAGRKNKQPFFLRLKSRKPFAFAGSGTPLTSCTIITTEPNELAASIHDRMPVILPRERYNFWLNPAEQPPEKLLPILRAFPAGDMEAYPVSTLVNNPKVDDPKCIEPAAA